MMPKITDKTNFSYLSPRKAAKPTLSGTLLPPKKMGTLILSSILLKVSARGTPTTMITTIPRAATPMRRQLFAH
jgi:hypothetical protein